MSFFARASLRVIATAERAGSLWRRSGPTSTVTLPGIRARGDHPLESWRRIGTAPMRKAVGRPRTLTQFSGVRGRQRGGPGSAPSPILRLARDDCRGVSHPPGRDPSGPRRDTPPPLAACRRGARPYPQHWPRGSARSPADKRLTPLAALIATG